ncbi:MAG: hypothetical protein ABIQ27_14105 [Flavobacterium sp.]|uniref:hypothetical protein n=1 Tax=Flavobacterium sp. TaxID=239 RepID=UPI0032670411
MTLCTAWIRKAGDNDELVFATDSCLSSGERWRGRKLFDLPRKDALICFAGRTDRAYPLILNLITALRYNKDFQDKAKDIVDLALFVSDLFTELVNQIYFTNQPLDQLKAEAEFLFGGWSWKNQQFVLFKIYYDTGEQKFVYDDCLAEKKTRHVVFIGDDDVIPIAKELCTKEFQGNNSDNVLDMEPLKVVTVISRDPEFTTVAGALQIAKIYKSGHNEFFGVMWESIKGKPHFLGKSYQQFEKPEVRYFDPDTLVIHEIELPEYLDIISENLFGEYISFVEKCYPNGKLKTKLSRAERNLLLEVLKHSFYKSVVNDLQDGAINEQEEAQQEEVVFEATGANAMGVIAEEVPVAEVAFEAVIAVEPEIIPQVEEVQPPLVINENENGDNH